MIDGDGEILQTLQERARHRPDASLLTFHQAILADTAAADVNWYSYSDSRLDGTVSAEELNEHFRNLRLQKQVAGKTATLSDVLGAWQPAVGDGDTRIELDIEQANALPLLVGADRWLTRIASISLVDFKSNPAWQDQCDGWLQGQGFRRDPHHPQRWSADPLLINLLHDRQQLEKSNGQLQHLLTETESTLEALQAAITHIFPYALYREKRPDLTALSNVELVRHFIHTGQQEGVELHFEATQNTLEDLRRTQAEDAARMQQMNLKMEQTKLQLEFLKDLIARQIPRHS